MVGKKQNINSKQLYSN